MSRASSRAWIGVLLALAAGGVLRLWFIHAYPELEGDPLIYGDIAKNWLLHGVYGLSNQGTGGIRPTLIRLPGYPLFLVACFKVFGVEHYKAVLYLQCVIDLLSCGLIALFVRRIHSARAGMIALWLAALCPFTANYVATPLSETLSIFCVALALYAAARLIGSGTEVGGIGTLLLLAFALSYAALLRPDGALLAVVLCPAVALYGARRWGWARASKYAVAVGVLAVLPFPFWAVRNYRTFHVFKLLAPRYAADPGEFVTPGFNRWMRTWCVEFTSTWEIYWNADANSFDIAAMPERAFDTPDQRQQTADLFEDYNGAVTMTPDVDARFAALAAERIHGHLLRYYLGMPLLRVADMWLRPRTEDLPIELRWWQYRRHPSETVFSVAYAALNFAYLALTLVGLLHWPRFAGAMLAFMVLRSLLLATIEAPEARYTLECFPVLFALAAVALIREAGQSAHL